MSDMDIGNLYDDHLSRSTVRNNRIERHDSEWKDSRKRAKAHYRGERVAERALKNKKRWLKYSRWWWFGWMLLVHFLHHPPPSSLCSSSTSTSNARSILTANSCSSWFNSIRSRFPHDQRLLIRRLRRYKEVLGLRKLTGWVNRRSRTSCHWLLMTR